jgi:hypothetical protein
LFSNFLFNEVFNNLLSGCVIGEGKVDFLIE